MNITLMTKDLETKKTEATTLLKAQMAAAEKENRERTAEELKAVDDKLGECRDLKARIDRAQGEANQLAEMDRLTAGLVPRGGGSDDPTERIVKPERRSLGAQFIESPDYRAFIKAQLHRRAGSWVSPTMELHATTLDSSAGSGGPLILPQQLPGILPLLFKRLMVGDLLPQGETTSNAVLYLQEKTFTNAAAATPEGGPKPESTLVFTNATSPVQKLAHWLPVTEEMLEDFPAIRAYIDTRLRLGIELTEEDELLNGSGTPPHLMGLMNVVGQTPAVVRGADSNADAIFKQITAIATTAFVQPDAIVINPVNWQTIQLTKNANGNYLGMGPWNTPQPPTLWGLPVAATPSIAVGTSLVGGFQMGAQEFNKGPMRVEVSNSHQDFFVKNLIAIRCEERLALAIYRPAAFGKVTGLA
jgi:HK97 family phage major capsid protein